MVTEDTRLLDKDAHTEDVPAHVVVDTERMHFLDPETGNAIRD